MENRFDDKMCTPTEAYIFIGMWRHLAQRRVLAAQKERLVDVMAVDGVIVGDVEVS